MKALIVILCAGGLLSGPLNGQALLEAVRSVAVDLDQDGQLEVVTVGRIGSYRPGFENGGVVRVGTLLGGRVEIVADAVSPVVVRDVAIGNYMGDGRPEVFSVGDGWLRVHRYESGSLKEVGAQSLASGWTDRIAVLNRKTVSIVAITEYEIQPDSDVGQTKVRAFEARAGKLREIWSLMIPVHVGDLAFVSDGERSRLILETGAGEEGGDVQVYDVMGSSRPRQVWGGRLNGGRRCLSIEITDPDRQEILLRSIDGEAIVYRLGQVGLQQVRRLALSTGSRVVPISGFSRASLVGRVWPGVLYRGASGRLFSLMTF